jgi:hypothetical protein
MNLDRTRTIVMGLAPTALLTFGLALGTERSPASHSSVPAQPAAERACVAVVAEHAACALPPRHTEQGEPLRASSGVR